MAYSKICNKGLPGLKPYIQPYIKIMNITHPIETVSLMKASIQSKATHFSVYKNELLQHTLSHHYCPKEGGHLALSVRSNPDNYYIGW